MEDLLEDFKMVSYVAVQGEWIPLDSVEFLDISEDFQGYDLITFNYQGKEYSSRVIQKYY